LKKCRFSSWYSSWRASGLCTTTRCS
jgi:hypothetical protein